MSQTKVKSGLLNFPDQTDFVKLPSGTTAQRPSSPEKGYSRYNTTDNKLEFWNGTIWQQLPGIVPPTIESVSYPGDDLAADPAGGQTITLTGTNFLDGATVEIEGTLAPVVTVVSKTEITFTTPAKTAGDYDILLTNGDNTTATFIDGITYNGFPSWTTPAGNLGTFAAGSTIPTITLVATEPDSGVVSYSVTTGALPTGLTLTGADIDGTVPTPAGQTTYNFSVTASDDENQSTERAFNIVVYLQVTNTVDEVDPFGNSSGVALYQLNGNANDLSNNHNGTWIGTEAYGTGVFGQAGVFNGTNAYINIGSSNSFGITDSMTVSLWVKFKDNENEWIIGNYPGGSYASGQFYLRRVHTENIINLQIYAGSGYQLQATYTFDVNSWYHIVYTKSSIANSDAFYINGVYIQPSLRDGTQGSGTLLNTSNTLSLANSNNLSSPANINLDQVRLFNTALTPLEVESLYQERTVVCGGQADTLDILGDNSCIATYQLNGNANDLSGDYSGTPTDVSYGVGEFDLAGVFNGSSSNIQLPALGLGGNQSRSVSVWIKLDSLATTRPVFCYGDESAGKGFNFEILSTGAIFLGYYQTDWSTTTTPITTNTWYHIVVTYNGGLVQDASSTVIYVNKVPLNKTTSAGYLGVANTTNTFYEIGKRKAFRYFDGEIDQVRIFNKALNSSEVTTLYNETACDALACSGTTNTLDILSDGSCIATYPLDGSPADLSGNYNGVQTDVTYPVGKFDLAGSFNGVGKIDLPSGINTLLGNKVFSVSLWAKDNGAVSDTVFSSGGANTFFLSANWTSAGNYALDNGSGSGTVVLGAVTDNWVHIVLNSNGSSGVEAFLNGVSKGTLAYRNADDPITSIGSLRGGGFNFSGLVDQVRIFNKALSAGEITTLYNETACN
jgi:hypothetical protein